MGLDAHFGINGRYLMQTPTGVQRYASNVVSAMDVILSDAGQEAPIIAPASVPDPGFRSMPLIKVGPLCGHAWEQTVLAGRWHRRLLNLCNTGPAVKANQVVCIHDANIFVEPGSYDVAFRTFYRTLQPLLAKRAARITTVSAYSARMIARYLSVRAADIAVLPNGHEHALEWDAALARAAPSIFAGCGRDFVLVLGSRARHKNLRLVIDAAPELAAMGIDVVVAGGGAGIFAPETLSTAANVRWLGYVTDHDLAYLMDRALCLLFPSWTEGFGLPIIEAMARECPVIASDRASMPEVCGDAALMAPPDDPAEWIRQVRRLASSTGLRQDLCARGRQRVELFSWAKTAAGYAELMREPKAALPPREVRDQPASKVAVIVATLGRAEILTATLNYLLRTQTLKPALVIISCVTREDAGAAADLPGVTIVTGSPGLTKQRNAGLAALPVGIDVVVFFDDDFVADANWLAEAARTFREERDVVAFTGHVLADGIKGPGLQFAQAQEILSTATRSTNWLRIEAFSPYGCNMAFRLSAIGRLRFDERLVLYGWQEDRDFGAALAENGGRLVKCATARGIHLGFKGGRVAGDRLGYSQVVNPIYMFRKGTMTLGQAAVHVLKNIASNLALAARPEPFIDRRGRLRGNLRAFADVLGGKIEPERAATLATTAPTVRTKSASPTQVFPKDGGDGAATS